MQPHCLKRGNQAVPNSITEVTRRSIMDMFTLMSVSWSGRLNEPEFLARLYDLRKMKSTDYRYKDAYGDITQHRVNNPEDWPDDYIFTDDRFNLLWGTDENLLNFLALTVHPIVRPDDEATPLVEEYNTILEADGYKFSQNGTISGLPLYKVVEVAPGTRQSVDSTPASRAKTAVELLDSRSARQPSLIQEWGTISQAVSVAGGAPGTKGIATNAHTSSQDEKRIFIVHGHDETAKNFVHLFLNRLTSTDAVVLHEQGNSGQSLIEKLENAANKVSFAVVLLTPDDLGKAKTAPDLEPRGRQNVVFEMGYFMALLGRDKVAVLHASDVTEPGDVRGMLYIPYESFAHDWKGKLAGELQAAGIGVDLSLLTR